MKKTTIFFLVLSLMGSALCAQNRKTVVSIVGDEFFIKGKPTYEGRYWNGHKVKERTSHFSAGRRGR